MLELFNRLIVLIASDDEKVDTSELIYETVELFINNAESLSVDEFYTIREYLVYKSSMYDLSVDDFQDLKSVKTLDELVTMLQIPKISLNPRTFWASRSHYTRESEIYDDLRDILLNKDSFKRKHKDYIHNLALKVARQVLDGLKEFDIPKDQETIQFRNLLKSVIQAYESEENEEHMRELESKINNQKMEVSVNSVKELALRATTKYKTEK